MAAKSITLHRTAAQALDALDGYALAHAGEITSAPLQNGTRVRITLSGGALALNVYPSKDGGSKIVFDRPDDPRADEVAALLGGTPSETKSKAASGPIEPVLPDAPAWVGSDESGKGDYFGPLVVAAVAIKRSEWRVLETLGVQDSKKLTDARAASLAREIAGAFPNEVVVMMPKRYNELWVKFGSVNRLLAWAHARAIEEVLSRAPEATAAVADQFGDRRLIENALFERGQKIELVQMPRAERDPAVAAASILARAEFIRRLDLLGRDAGVRLPKGASAAVDATARAVVAKQGPAILDQIAKRHFKTTQRVL
ncbi:MAG TPA: ribonuclease HIII [Dehalococcoidia bacterium]